MLKEFIDNLIGNLVTTGIILFRMAKIIAFGAAVVAVLFLLVWIFLYLIPGYFISTLKWDFWLSIASSTIIVVILINVVFAAFGIKMKL